MDSKAPTIKILGYALAIPYAILFLIHINYFKDATLKQNASIILVLSAIILVAALAAALLRNWGRILLMVIAGVTSVYLLYPVLAKQGPLYLSYLIFSLIVVLFYNQEKVKAHFLVGGAGKWKCILVIDDDESLIKTVRPILISSGYSVLSANSGEAGINIAAKQKPDLILLDVILPGMKGREVCRTLKDDQRTKDIPVIFLTAKDSPDDIQAETDAGAADHITKPVNSKELVATVAKTLAK